MRHGEAGKRLAAGGKDSERSLTVMGQKEVQEVARALSWLDEKIDLVVTSPLKRSAQTAQIVAKELKLKKGAVEEWDELKPEGNRAALLRKLSQFKQESSVLVIGHEPYLSTMISEIVSGTSSGGIVLKKAGLARIGVTSLRPKVKGELRWLLTPRHLKKMAK
jgi:phosphohistidine phosphatase